MAIFGLVLVVIAVFSPQVGLGREEKFFLYQILNVSRRTLFSFGLAIAVLTVLAPLLSHLITALGRTSWKNVMNLARLARWYSISSVILINFLIAFAVLNVAIYFWYPVPIRDSNLLTDWYDKYRYLDKFTDDQLAQVYPGMNREQANDVARQTALLRSVYEPFVQFQPAPVVSKYMNVHEAGFRSIGQRQGPWPLSEKAVNIFVFGGSTAFGPGVADNQTIAAHLQVRLREVLGTSNLNVYNFGAGAYIAQQERAKFEQLLIGGHRPDAVIFIDGLNEFILIKGEPAQTNFLRRATDILNELTQRRDLLFNLKQTFDSLPIGRILKPLKESAVDSSFGERIVNPDLKATGPINAAIDRYLANLRLTEGVASAFGVQPLFVWQPIPFYEYAMEAQSMAILGGLPSGHEQALRPKFAYPLMKQRLDQGWPSKNFHWCADIQRGESQLFYIDHVHYSGGMGDRVAACVIDGLNKRGGLDVLKRKNVQVDPG